MIRKDKSKNSKTYRDLPKKKKQTIKVDQSEQVQTDYEDDADFGPADVTFGQTMMHQKSLYKSKQCKDTSKDESPNKMMNS